jgi:hypothetical protein
VASQFGQDCVAIDLLGGLRGGFFLDSGAGDGVTVSNTQLLEERFGWTGICVEPNSEFFTALVRNRRCQCVNCCFYYFNGSVEFVEAEFLGGIPEHFAGQHLQLLEKLYGSQPKTVLRPARTIRSVLKDCNAPRVIDYWSLDTEGSELSILKSFPFDEYSFRVLTVEHNRLPVKEDICRFLNGYGYNRVKTIGIDDCYTRAGELARPRQSQVWQRRSSFYPARDS